MSSNSYSSNQGFGNLTGGMSSRRGGQGIKPMPLDILKAESQENKENALPTPRTSRSHLLAGLRTAPKSATAATFGTASSNNGPTMQYAAMNARAAAQNDAYNAPKTAFPQYGGQQNNYASIMAQQQQQLGQQYTVEQVLAPPELPIDEQGMEQMDPNLYAQLVATNAYLAQQQQRLQQQLRNVQAAAQQFQQLNLSNPNLTRQQMELYQQQQQLRNMQQQLGVQAALSQGQQHIYYDQMTGQYFVDTAAMGQMTSAFEQPMTPGGYQFHQQQQQQQYPTPRVQVSPPPETQVHGFRSNSPPKRRESPTEVTPLPPPSANAFRRNHKKIGSIAPINSALAAAANADGIPMSAGPRTAGIPQTPMTGGYGPGQGRAGEHPVRQPRGPPSLDELKEKPTAKHQGSKNFATRTRRSLVSNLVRAGLERRKGTGSSAGSMSPVSETAEDSTSPITDNESESGRSGSGSLAGEEECNSSHTSASGSWGAIGSDRPSSRQKSHQSMDSADGETSSFANVFKNGALRGPKAPEATDGQRKAPRLVLTSAEKRKSFVA